MKKINRLFVIFILSSIVYSSCKDINPKLIEPGVSKELATLREKQLSDIKYFLSFSVPDSVNEKVQGHSIIEFNFNKELNKPLILDFRNPETFVKSVKIDKKEINYEFKNEHIIINAKLLQNGKNKLEIEFVAGDRALNRNTEYLYTLFVPDRACTAFPSFDQPSLKAKFQTEINVPGEWISVANSPLIDKKEENSRSIYIFDETEPISTYIFSFVAGKFQSVSKTYDEREIIMYHREDDLDKVKNNTNKIFDLHYGSLKWLEEYTQIEYPFTKFDFVIIPSFQYSGMEHPGAILYRDSRLFLEKNATIREKLNRANLIAHETAHMWFGDLVTMEWFSEVWLKEVFANFMAGKIVNPQYPEVNHDLNFLINHYPSSYSVDRTKGANPIEQELDNMKNAGTLYGSIIYHKAPIIMNQLEKIIGNDLLKEGIQEYLIQNMYGNATWDDLINILDNKTDKDLKRWSHAWVYEPRMPHYNVQKAYNVNNKLESIIIEQLDPAGKGRQWNQEIKVLLAHEKGTQEFQVELKDTFSVVNLLKKELIPEYVFPNSDGLGYGYFEIDSISIIGILNQLSEIKDPVLRCSMYISLWENMLNENINPSDLYKTFLETLDSENNAQNINLLLGYVKSIYWKFTPNKQRDLLAKDLESFLWEKVLRAGSAGLKSSFFNAYRSIILTENGINNLYHLWKDKIEISNLELTEKDFTKISFELALRNIPNTESVLDKQYERIKNTEKKDRFNFMRQAVSTQEKVRDNFFEKLKDEKNREKEPWVIDALYYLHHPLRSEGSVKYLRPSLDILEEIQVTGDIFFPKRWLDASFAGHNSVDAVTEVNLFLNENPGYPDNLKNKILQSTDLVFRASIINNE